MSQGGVSLIERGDAERHREVAILFSHHYTPMCRLAYVMLGDAAAAEEIVMEALLKTFTGWSRIRNADSTDAYLRRAVVNLCRSKMRRNALETRVNAVVHLRQHRHVPAWDPDRHATSSVVWDAVRALPERQRACIVLRYLEDLPDAHIAEILDCSLGTVKSQLSKARAKLERALGPWAVGGER
ncbi:MAG: SigE family RNA polymerase sigma factor [Actinomycetota bacterium]